MPPVYSKKAENIFIGRNGSEREKRISPCEKDCLLDNHIQQVQALIAAGEVDKSLLWLHARNPFPGITGRVCPHPCENGCNRHNHDEGVAIHLLERYAADKGRRPAIRSMPSTGKKIAVIGSGPAGLAAARYAALLGHAVNVYEKSPVMGGAPRQVIPDFRLPKDIVDRETAAAIEENVNVFTNTTVGRDIFISDLLKNHDACILAAGLWRERILNIPGKEYLTPAVAWLKRMTLDRESFENRDVVILGGGGIAFDCAFTAIRLHARSVNIICLEDEQSMRAPAEEVQQARDEGITVNQSLLAQEVEKTDGRYTVRASKVASFSFDAHGELHVEFTGGEPLRFNADLVICASGLMLDEEVLTGVEVERTPRGMIRIDDNFRSSRERLFATGDMAFGPGLVAGAIGQGREAALAAHNFLMDENGSLDVYINPDGFVETSRGGNMPEPHVVDCAEIMNIDYHEHGKRGQPAGNSPELAFGELAGGYAEDEAIREAARCMHCGRCMSCGSCVDACPGHILDMDEDGPYVAYPDQCWHCGCCRIACPTSSIAYKFPLTMML